MKPSIVTTFTISVFTFMGTANAFVTPTFSPGIPQTYTKCMGKPGASHVACSTLFAAKRSCELENSDSESDWRDCLAAAEASYHKSLGIAATDEPYMGETLPVSTNTADALYEYPADDERKGYLQAKER